MNCIVQNEDMQVMPEHETMSVDLAVTDSKVEPLESCPRLGTNETYEHVSSTLGPRILDTYSLHADSMVSSEETVSSARKSFKQLSAEGFFRCGNRDRSCSYLTQLPTQFDAHMREKHASEKAFPCVHCGSLEMTCDSLLQHLDQHLPHQSMKLYGCAESTCDFDSSSPEDVLQHIISSHSTLTSFRCWCCSTSFSSIHTFLTHIKKNILQVVTCPHCAAKDTDRQRILTHISTSHPSYGRMVTIHKIFLCVNRTMSAWHDQNAAEHAEQQDFSDHNSTASDASRERPPVLPKIAPVVRNRNLKQETDFIDLTGSEDCEVPEDNLSSDDEMIIEFDNKATKLRDNARCRVTSGKKSQNKVCERRVIDSSCRQSTAATVESSATSVDRDEHDDAGETEMEISHYEEVGNGCVLASNVQKSGAAVKRNYRTRKFARPQTRTVQEPNVSSKSSNRPIPSTAKIVTKDHFSSKTSGDETTYFCIHCTYTFNTESKNNSSINSRMWQHIKNKHKQNTDSRNEPLK